MMVKNKSAMYLVYVDILGFEKLAEELAKKSGFDEDTIRERFLTNPFREKIKEINKENVEVSKGISEIEGSKGSDNYILFVDTLDRALEIIGNISAIRIPHKDYGYVPVEAALGMKEFDDGINIKDQINRKKTIQFLNEDIINPYRKIYEKEHNGESIKKTFILLTEDIFNEFEGFDRKSCEEISYAKKHFYYLPNSIIERKLKISDFLNKIRQSRSDYSGALIDRIFVPPDEYDEIKESLKKDRIIFITGTVGYGKTYTAIRLLWEWDGGCTPKWISGKEEEDRKNVRERLANIDAELEPNHIIYFEDPFGKTKYERRDDLKERINHIKNSVKNKEDVYVIITSRKDVFEEFEKECYSIEEIREFEKELNILKPSYSCEKRKQILEEWAEEKGCKWLNDANLKSMVFESLEEERNLPTPLSIHDFVEATIKITAEKELRQKIDAYSREVEKAFADEIKGLYDSGRRDRVLFLSFVFVSGKLKLDFIKQEYEKLKGDNFEDFERILDEEYRVKIGTSWSQEKILRFSHPSYSKALTHILEHPGCRKIFCNVLKELADKDPSVRGDIAESTASNFDKFPELAHKLLIELSEDEKAQVRWRVAHAVANNFDKFPDPELAEELLNKLSEDEYSEVRWNVASAVGDNFNKIPEKVSKKLLKELSEDEDADVRRTVPYAVAKNFDKFSELAQELLTKLSEDEDEYVRGKVAEAVAKNFDKLSKSIQKLLAKLSEDEDSHVRGSVACAVITNFDKFPPELAEKIIIKLSKDGNAGVREDIVRAAGNNFDKFPELAEKIIIISRGDDDIEGERVAYAIGDNIGKFSLWDLLDGSEKEPKSVIEELSKSEDSLDREIAVEFAESKLRKEFAIEILTELSSDEDKYVKEKALSALKKFQ